MKLPKNVRRFENNNVITYRYYNTDILTINRNTKIITINSGGFNTKSTQRHIQNMAKNEGFNLSISFANNEITINFNGNTTRHQQSYIVSLSF